MKPQRNRLLAAVLLIGFLTPCAPLFAQESLNEPVKTIIEVKHDFYRVMNVVNAFVAGDGDRIRMTMSDEGTRLIGIMGLKPLVEQLEAAVKKYDVPPPPPKSIELIVYMVEARTEVEPRAEQKMVNTPVTDLLYRTSPTEESWTVPTALDDVVTELKKIFAYSHYRSIESTVLRVRDGSGGETSGSLLQLDGQTSRVMKYSVYFDTAHVTEDGPTSKIGFDSFQMGIELPETIVRRTVTEGDRTIVTTSGVLEAHRVTLRADIDVREGQKVVVGKTSIALSEALGNGAIFVVVTAKVVD